MKPIQLGIVIPLGILGLIGLLFSSKEIWMQVLFIGVVILAIVYFIRTSKGRTQREDKSYAKAVKQSQKLRENQRKSPSLYPKGNVVPFAKKQKRK